MSHRHCCTVACVVFRVRRIAPPNRRARGATVAGGHCRDHVTRERLESPVDYCRSTDHWNNQSINRYVCNQLNPGDLLCWIETPVWHYSRPGGDDVTERVEALGTSFTIVRTVVCWISTVVTRRWWDIATGATVTSMNIRFQKKVDRSSIGGRREWATEPWNVHGLYQ